MTQCDKILKFMKDNNGITPRDAMCFGCYRLGARIFDLKKAGHAISTTIITVTNRDGTRSNVARYTLVDGDKT